MKLVNTFNKKLCVGTFIVVFCASAGFMLGSLQSLGIIEEKAKLTDKLNQAEMELFEAERQLVHCDSELGHKINAMMSGETSKTIFIITPTYTRPTQLAELTVLAQALEHVPYLHWIVLEFAFTNLVSRFLSSTNIKFTHLDSNGTMSGFQPGINACNALRNIALDHMTKYHSNSTGVILFANLDRIYSTDLFDKVRNIKKVGIWPTVFADEQFQCNPLTFSSKTPKYPINLGSIGFSTDILQKGSRARFPIKISDTEGISWLLEAFIEDKDEIEVIKCSGEYVWYKILLI